MADGFSQSCVEDLESGMHESSNHYVLPRTGQRINATRLGSGFKLNVQTPATIAFGTQLLIWRKALHFRDIIS